MSFNTIYQGYVVPASTLLPIAAGLVNYKRVDRSLRTLTWYLCFALTINVIAVVLASRHTNNMPLLHFYTAGELVLVTLYFKHAFNDRKTDRWLNLIMIMYPVLCVVNFVFFQSIYSFNTYTRPLEALIIILLSALYFAWPNTDRVTTAGRWVAGGFLLYFCSSFFQFIFSNVVSHYASKAQKSLIWNMHATFVLMMYVLFFVAIFHGRNKR